MIRPIWSNLAFGRCPMCDGPLAPWSDKNKGKVRIRQGCNKCGFSVKDRQYEALKAMQTLNKEADARTT